MKADHPLERAIPAIRLRRKRRGERLAHFHLASEEDRVDLIGATEWPSTFSRRLTQFLLERIDQQPGAVLHAWWVALYHGRQRRRGHNWMVGAAQRLGDELGHILGSLDHPQARALCAKFPPQWNRYEPWEDLVRGLAARGHPHLQRVIMTLGQETLPRSLTVSGYLPNEGSQQFVRFLIEMSDPQTLRWWFPAFLEQVQERMDQHQLHPWQLHGFKVLFGRSLEDVILERYEEQLDVLVGLDIEDWVRVGRKVADMFVYFHEQHAARRTCETFMSAWLNAEGPWQALELSGHPIALALAHHPRLRRDTLMGGLDPYRVGENPEGERRAL